MSSELPDGYATQEVNHLTLAYFSVAGLSLLRELDRMWLSSVHSFGSRVGVLIILGDSAPKPLPTQVIKDAIVNFHWIADARVQFNFDSDGAAALVLVSGEKARTLVFKFLQGPEGMLVADYDNLVGVMLFNHLEVDFDVKPSDRTARMIVHVITMPDVGEVEDLDAIFRGEGGFGSSGV
ncbi:deoxyuridine 5'-triphosphate nucleotidohydrolase-like [Triticum aestivum]|uniref:deoxyuridine 5'-triphosphate nucleotidohydrolase-like n=1 Tax=Triticum aestivum TaxID=4565 RepID=UPI001D0160A7|nr:deoxyuridine 5'-triphosphate nucleotidohydrolase-like [Triticum aestivum]